MRLSLCAQRGRGHGHHREARTSKRACGRAHSKARTQVKGAQVSKRSKIHGNGNTVERCRSDELYSVRCLFCFLVVRWCAETGAVLCPFLSFLSSPARSHAAHSPRSTAWPPLLLFVDRSPHRLLSCLLPRALSLRLSFPLSFPLPCLCWLLVGGLGRCGLFAARWSFRGRSARQLSGGAAAAQKGRQGGAEAVGVAPGLKSTVREMAVGLRAASPLFSFFLYTSGPRAGRNHS
jgi:hypothetical protein